MDSTLTRGKSSLSGSNPVASVVVQLNSAEVARMQAYHDAHPAFHLWMTSADAGVPVRHTQAIYVDSARRHITFRALLQADATSTPRTNTATAVQAS